MTDGPICPVCSVKEVIYLDGDEFTEEFRCGSCGREYTVSVSGRIVLIASEEELQEEIAESHAVWRRSQFRIVE